MQVEKYFASQFTSSDQKNKDITRNCFLSCDPEIYINRDALPFVVKNPPEVKAEPKAPAKKSEKESAESKKAGDLKHNLLRIEQITEYLTKNNLSITFEYEQWNAVGIALFRTFEPEVAEYWYRQLSMLDEGKFKPKEFAEICKYLKNYVQNPPPNDKKYTFGTIVHYAKAVGFTPPKRNPLVFWHYEEDDNGRRKAVIERPRFIYFLNEIGFRKWFISPDEPVFVRIVNNIVEQVSKKQIQDIVSDYILQEVKSEAVYGTYCKMLKELYSDYLLQEIENNDLSSIKKDDRFNAYVFYKNGYVHIHSKTETFEFIPNEILTETTTDRTFKPYESLDGLVWKSSILPRDYQEISPKETKLYDKSNEFSYFIYTISGNRVREGQTVNQASVARLNAFETAIGYLIHQYKNKAVAKAVVLMDEQDAENTNEANGGTGKGLFMQGIQHMTKVLNLKDYDSRGQFNFQKYTHDTRVLFYSDVPKRFDFNGLFSSITENLEVEKKNKQSFDIPFEASPKFCIATNFVLTGEGKSYERRTFLLEFAPYYTPDYTPLDEFGHLLFDDWNDHQWALFDNYMLHCLEKFLSNGFMQYNKINMESRKARQVCGAEFLEWADTNLTVGCMDTLHGFIVKYTNAVNKHFSMRSETMKLRLTYFCKMNKWKLTEQPRKRDPMTGKKEPREYKIEAL
jgi:hypothetical protein